MSFWGEEKKEERSVIVSADGDDEMYAKLTTEQKMDVTSRILMGLAEAGNDEFQITAITGDDREITLQVKLSGYKKN